MYTVYVLIDKEGNLYNGMTSDLPRRLKEHRARGTKTTRKMFGIEVVYTEEYEDRLSARKREIFEISSWKKVFENKGFKRA